MYAGNREDDQCPWEVVGDRRNRNREGKPKQIEVNKEIKMDPHWGNPEAWSTTLYVTNFPPSASIQGLKDTCSKVARVIDVFIPNRLSRMGKQFAFFRFKKEVGTQEIIAGIRSLWIGSYRLFADETRFKRGEGTSKTSAQNSNGAVGKVATSVWIPAGQSGTYAQVTKGKVEDGKREPNPKIDGEIFDDPLVLEEDLEASLIMKVRDINLMSKVYLHAHNEGFSDVSFRYVGGMWLRVDCSSKEVCTRFENCDAMKNISPEIRKVDVEFCVDEKVVWLEVRGLALIAWSNAVFRHVDKINELVNYMVKGKVYKLLISEAYAWNPSFERVSEEDNDSVEEEFNDFEERESNDSESIHSMYSRAPVLEDPKIVDSDPFKIMDIIRLIDKEKNDLKEPSVTPSKLPGFSQNGPDFSNVSMGRAKVDIFEDKGDAKVHIHVVENGDSSKKKNSSNKEV
ncbi:hypothetical protein SSX86_003942 [Deinandra increscens subsp. villosa]|uniref:RRM domain-containing protein n=1 Tax=Deinandra increscens subsp. villosa TaxID=3103831 RepID=A0AAP0H8C1_9ASTR